MGRGDLTYRHDDLVRHASDDQVLVTRLRRMIAPLGNAVNALGRSGTVGVHMVTGTSLDASKSVNKPLFCGTSVNFVLQSSNF